MPRSDVALRNGTGCTGTARLQTEAACQTISTRADLAATFFFAAQATFALILSPYFYRFCGVPALALNELAAEVSDFPPSGTRDGCFSSTIGAPLARRP